MPESPLTPTYTPAPVEARWTAEWERRGLFRAEAAGQTASRRPFVIVMPPPNITGSLHLGHALNNTLQDILIRWRRMCGDAALWVPGTDHAGIATQNVVERQLMAEGKTRQQLGREAFIARVWQWRNESGRAIVEQLKRLGASCDWSREAFTMDDDRAAAVREAFVSLHRDGLIYRGQRLINWCPRCHTALSDIEVEHEETRGRMYHIKYPLADEAGAFLTVATTRPETLLGDTAVAVHPDDPRFNRFIGRQVRLPLTNRTIPIIGDPILVDREFGTGAVKITPAHDFNDEKAGQRHNLPAISILDEQARISPSLDEHGVDAAVLADITQLTVPKARTRIEHWLQERELLLKVEDHTLSLGKCYRCRTVVEPYRSPQWFVSVNVPGKSLAKAAIDAVRSGRIRFIPEGWANNYFGWMEQIEDWCISRQIWWGHQIPAWYCRGNDVGQCRPECKEPIVALTAPNRCPHCGSADLVQDPDVLDTWFSSGLWPFSTLGWPKQTADLKTFYPTSVLVTSFDIIFFWVARMVMMGLHVMKEVPFRTVYIHALVRDAEGQKMSKSKGNVIDPLVMMDKYGTDALRFTLASMASPGRDIRLAEERIAGYRNFANKLWNAARFVLTNAPAEAAINRPPAAVINHPPAAVINQWIRSRLHRTIEQVNHALEPDRCRFDEAAQALYQFVWHEFCDWYLELAKGPLLGGDAALKRETGQTLISTLEQVLRLLHPLMPFITEELWAQLPHDGDSLVTAAYPQYDPAAVDEEIERVVDEFIIQPVTAIRNLRAEMNLSLAEELAVAVGPKTPAARNLFEANLPSLQRLARVAVKECAVGLARPKTASTVLAPWGEIYVLLNEKQIRAEIERLGKALLKLDKEIEPVEKKFQDQQFVSRAPKEVVAKLDAQRAELQDKRRTIAAELERNRQMLA
jgi:valyl-tRNA synthetase